MRSKGIPCDRKISPRPCHSEKDQIGSEFSLFGNIFLADTTTGAAVNVSPACTIIDSARSTHPPSPTIPVAKRPSRSPVPGSIEHVHLPTDLDAFQVESRNDALVSETEGELRVLVEGSFEMLLAMRQDCFAFFLID